MRHTAPSDEAEDEAYARPRRTSLCFASRLPDPVFVGYANRVYCHTSAKNQQRIKQH